MPPGVGADAPIGGGGQPHPLEQLAAAAPGLAAGDPVQGRLQLEQLVAGHERVDGRVLQGDADDPAHLLGLRAHVEAGHPGPALGDAQQGHQHPHQGGLARPVGPEEPEDLTLVDDEVDPVHRDDVTEAADEALGHDRARHEGCSTLPAPAVSMARHTRSAVAGMSM